MKNLLKKEIAYKIAYNEIIAAEREKKLHRSEIEASAQTLYHNYHKETLTYKINIEELEIIAHDLGWKVRVKDFETKKGTKPLLDYYAIPDCGKKIIYLSTKIIDGAYPSFIRARYALAHELGRIILHRSKPIHQALKLFDPIEFNRKNLKHQYEARYFARALLMPENKVTPIIKNPENAEDPFCIDKIKNYFDVDDEISMHRVINVLKLDSHFIKLSNSDKEYKSHTILDDETYIEFKEKKEISLYPLLRNLSYKIKNNKISFSAFVCFPSGDRYFYHLRKVGYENPKNKPTSIICIGLRASESLYLLNRFPELKKLEVINIG